MRHPLQIGDLIRTALIMAEGLEELTDVFPLVSQDATTPYVAYQIAGMDYGTTKSGNTPNRATVKVGVFAGTYDDAVRLGELVIEVLKGINDEGARCWTPTNITTDTDGDDTFAVLVDFNVRTNYL